MPPRLLAFDLDGTLLTTDKQLSRANKAALQDMVSSGARIALASGRLGSAMQPYAEMIGTDIAMLTLNGAAVFTSAFGNPPPIYRATLPGSYAQELIAHAREKPFVLNYYCDGLLYALHRPAVLPWIDLYMQQTGSHYHFIDSFEESEIPQPSKIIFVGAEDELDRQEEYFRRKWDNEIYICRTWSHYLEFLHTDANKGSALEALAQAFKIDMTDVVTFGDSENDIPMLKLAGTGIAVSNALESAKRAASKVSCWSNDEDAVAREWELLKKTF